MMAWWLVAALAGEPTLEEVLVSVDAHFPLLLAAEAEVAAAEGALLASRGWFDPVLGASAGGAVGRYEQVWGSASVGARTAAWGLGLDAGWTLGVGDFPAYAQARETLDRGELFVDARLPLLKGGWTDEGRTEVTLSRAGVAEAEAKLTGKRIDYAFAAREAWFKWVGAGEKLAVAESQRDVAIAQLDAVDRRIAQGDLAAIDRVDAQRVLAERELKVRELQRDLAVAALKLGLFLRADDGSPAPPTGPPPRLPESDGAVEAVDAAVARALAARPELLALAAKADAVAAKVRLARVSVLPKLDLKAGVAQELPTEETKPVEVKVGAELALPFALREGRGKLEAALADRARVTAEQRYAADRISAEVRSAWEMMEAARDRLALAVEQVGYSRELEVATRRGFELGDRTLFDLYLREQSRLKAELDRVDVAVELHLAAAALLAATGAR
jgi:cobalt-zinc-cadmium efflux system outer membrane protein